MHYSVNMGVGKTNVYDVVDPKGKRDVRRKEKEQNLEGEREQ